MGRTYVVVLHKLASSSAHGDAKRAEHALALTQVGLPILLVLDIHIESFTLKEDLQVGVVLENRVASNLVQHSFQGSSPGLDEIGIESTHGLLLRWGGDNHTGVAVVQGIIKPEEITVSATDSELGHAICFRCCLVDPC